MSMFMDEALSSEDRSGIEAHLASCDRCRSELDGMLEVASVLRDRTAVDLALPQVVRSRIAREAAIRTQGGRWPFALPEWLYSVRPGALATGAAIVVALLVLPAVIHQRDAQQGRSEPVSTIRVTADGQAVHLAWSDGSRSSYTVYKSHDPRVFGRAEAHVIRGNSWVDRDADGAPIVFYRIE